MRRAAALAAALLLLPPAPVAAQDGTPFVLYLAHQADALGGMTDPTPDSMIAWGARELEWSRANPPDACYVEMFTVGVAVGEAVRAAGYMAGGLEDVGLLYLDEVVEPMMAEWVGLAAEAAC